MATPSQRDLCAPGARSPDRAKSSRLRRSRAQLHLRGEGLRRREAKKTLWAGLGGQGARGESDMTAQAGSLRDQGIAAFREGRVEDAITLLREAVSGDPRDHRAYAVLGAAYCQRGEYEDAIAAFESARGIRPDAAHIHFNLGLALQRAGRPQDAIAAFQAAVEVDPSYEKAKDALSRARAALAQGASPPQAREAPPETPGEAQPAQEPPAAPRRMPIAPPAPTTAPRGNDAAPDVMLQPLGGGPWQQASTPAPPDAPGAPPRAPWEPQEGPAPAIPRMGPGGPREGPGRREKTPAQSEYAAAGAVTGAIYGALFMVVLMIVDRILSPDMKVISRVGPVGWIPLMIGGLITGAIFGAIIGIPTAISANPSTGILTGLGLWMFVTLILLIARRVTGPPLVLGLLMGAVYGILMGWVVGNQVHNAIKRK